MQSLQLSPPEAATELLNRRKARNRLIPFTEYTLPRYHPAAHHRLIAERLEQVERGEIDRLLICMPPRHGKSELASRRFPAWFLGRNGQCSVIAASYNSDLASDFGREVRNIVGGPEYRALFGISMAQDSSAANRWHTSEGGAYVAAGVGTAVTGRGADVLLIDDPVKDREEADSELRRERVWQWYTSTAYTRLAPGGRIVLIQTRWHEDDLAGRILEHSGSEWEVLDLPAIDERGEALWPERYSIDVLKRIKSNIGPREWSALYQQSPSPDEGAFFRRDWFQWYDELPKRLQVYGASDYAVTADGGDYTVHVVVGVDEHQDIYLLDLWRGQTDADVWIERFLDLCQLHKPLMWAEEKGQIVKSVGPFIEKRAQERKVYAAREQFSSVADKPTRARAIQARAAMGKVYLPRHKDWAQVLLNELLMFPAGKHDDQVDAFSLIGRMLDHMIGAGPAPAQREPEPMSGYKEMDEDIETVSIKTL